jgi:biotin/methionine sulfoxide reductase
VKRLSHSHWGAFEAQIDNGVLESVLPFKRDRNPSPLIASIPSAVYSPNRITDPMVRKGYLERGIGDRTRKRGAEPFVSVSWDHALDLVAEALRVTKTDHGNQAIFGGSYGWSSAGRINHARTLLHRFLYKFGGCVDQVTNYSWGAAAVLLPHIVGGIEPVAGPVTDWSSIAKHTELMVLFGGASLKNSAITTGGAGSHDYAYWLQQAVRSGVKFISISPIRCDAPEWLGADWLAIRPGTDTALLLALAHTLIVEKHADIDFLEKYTVGYDRFKDYLLGTDDGTAKSAKWASGITDISEQIILDLARRMSTHRTMLSATWSLQRADHGEQPYWALISLAAILGQIGTPGGGFGFGYGSINGIGTPRRQIPTPTMETGPNPLNFAIPVARIVDLLLNPGGTLRFNGKTLKLPDIRLVYWCGGNPFHHHQDINRLLTAWQKPETIIVQDIWWTATARHADIVLPATTPWERNDIGSSPRDSYVFAMPKILEPLHRARNDFDIFTELAKRLGIEKAFTEGRTIDNWMSHAYEIFRKNARVCGVDLPNFESFWAAGYVEIPPPDKDFILYSFFRKDPMSSPLRTPSGKIEIYSQTIDEFGYDDCGGHAKWIPPREWHGARLAKTFPLALISNQPATRLHGQLDDAVVSLSSKVAGREPVRINPEDAKSRGITNGSIVRVFNDRGQCLAGAVITDDVRPGVIQLSAGAWYSPTEAASPGSLDEHGNPNLLTHDIGTSRLGQGPSLSALVEVETWRGKARPIRAHRLPEIALSESNAP